MKKLLFLTFLISNFCFSSTTLLLVGGGKRPKEAMAKFVERAGGKEAKILVIPFASGSIESAQMIRNELLPHSPQNVSIVDLELSQADVQELKEKFKTITGVFFTGGDQNNLMAKLNLYGLKDIFRAAYKEGVSFAGTSAGTAIMSRQMLTGKSDLSVISPDSTELAEGLGLLPENIIVDQHFIIRSRFNRLASLILGTKKLGIGVDENNALLVTDNTKAEVIGPTQVLFYTSSSAKDLQLKILSDGDTYTLNN